MADHFADHDLAGRRHSALSSGKFWAIGVLSLIALMCIGILEARFFGLKVEQVVIEDTPVTLYSLPTPVPKPAVVVAHGFAGSRQMIDQIAVTLAHQGFLVASLDLPGHGRNGTKLSPDITRIEGTTAQLVAVVEQVAAAVAARADAAGSISFVGHSMATDVVIRAAQARDDVGSVVAISMYSPAVTDTHPKSLLVLSGATEGHLRNAGLDAVRLLAPEAQEGETVTRNGVTRRTAVAPYMGHVGVLYAPQSLSEIADWLRNESESTGPLDQSGAAAGVLLLSLVLLMWPLSSLVPTKDQPAPKQMPWRTFWTCIALPIPVVLAAAVMPTFGIAGNAVFGSLALIFAAWGWVQIAILRRAGVRLGLADTAGALIYLGFALLFALALDRYGAAFVPAGTRILVLAGLLVGTIPLMIADTMLVHNASILRRILVRVSTLTTLAVAMALSPQELGLSFTTLPVLALFFLVYGTIARWIAQRRGPASVALGKGFVLAWAIAASTPLFAVGVP